MSRKLIIVLAFAFIHAGVAGDARAEISAEQIARLSADLTPFGGERAGTGVHLSSDISFKAWA